MSPQLILLCVTYHAPGVLPDMGANEGTAGSTGCRRTGRPLRPFKDLGNRLGRQRAQTRHTWLERVRHLTLTLTLTLIAEMSHAQH